MLRARPKYKPEAAFEQLLPAELSEKTIFFIKNIARDKIYRYYEALFHHIKDKTTMGLIRIIVIALIIYLVIQIYKRWAANKASNITQKEQQQKLMVKCDVCQLHVPKNEALQDDGKYYCSQNHYDERQG